MSSTPFDGLDHVDAVQPLADADRACLAEVRDVLRRHGRMDRFGVCLLHRHFDLAEGECLVEVSDPAVRRMTVEAAAEASVPEDRRVETSWRLVEGSEMTVALQVCVRNPQTGAHERR